jgi:hypothetical protein
MGVFDPLLLGGILAHLTYFVIPFVRQPQPAQCLRSEGYGQLHNPQARPQVAARGGNGLQMLVPDLSRNLFELANRKTVQLVGMGDVAQVHRTLGTAAGSERGKHLHYFYSL